MTEKRPTKTEIVEYVREHYFEGDEWHLLMEEIIRYR